MGFNFAPPQGYPGGGSATQPVKVATGSATSSTSTASFILVGGTSAGSYSLSLPVPSGASNLVVILANDGTITTVASPSGYVYNAISSGLAASEGNYIWEAGGALSLTTASIVIPAQESGSVYDYAVYYQT